MDKKVIRNFDSSKASGPDCIPVVVWTYVLSDLWQQQELASELKSDLWDTGLE